MHAAAETPAIETHVETVHAQDAAPAMAPVEAMPVSAAEPAPVAAPVVEPAPYTSVASEERVVEYAAKPVVPSAPVALNPIVLPHDLTQIETDPEKLRIAASKVAPPAPPRPPRVRPPLPPISNEPLIQVETRK